MQKRTIAFVAMVLVALSLAPGLAAQQAEAEKPLTEKQVYDLLQGGTDAAKVAEMIKARGVDFVLEERIEANLSTLKADLVTQTIKTPSQLEIQLGVAGVTVAVDGEERGETGADGTLIIGELSGGGHVLRISSPDHIGKSTDVFLKPAEEKSISIKLTSAVSAMPGPYGTNVSVAAGTRADAALSKVITATDAAAKIAVLEQVAADFADSPVAVLAYDMLQKNYLSQKSYDQALAAGAELIARDPQNVSARVGQARATLAKGDIDGALGYSEEVARMLEAGKTLAAPEGVAESEWTSERERALRQINAVVPSLQYDLFLVAYRLNPAAARAAALERFVTIFPESPYRVGSYSGLALAYQQQQNQAKMIEWADKALEAKPDEPNMLMLMSDYLSDQNRELERAQELAARLLDLVTVQEGKVRAPGVTDEQWATQKAFYVGIAHTVLGMIQFHHGQLPAAVKEFEAASPSLQSQPFYKARNLYRWGLSLARLGGRSNLKQAQTILNEVIGLNSPFSPPAQDLLAQVNQKLGGG